MKIVRAGLVAVCAFTAFAASDFWNRKEVATWSEEETMAFKTKSPWAKKVHLDIGSGGRGGGGARGGGVSAEDGGLSGAMPSSGRGNRGGIRPGEDISQGGGAAGIDIIVRWESAAPVLAATKLQLPPTMLNDYVIGLTGLPPRLMQSVMVKGLPETEDAAARQKAAVDNLLHSATLTVKGKDPQSPEFVVQTTDKTSILFAFPKQTAGVSATDKEVQFVMKLPIAAIKAKFDPREMTYKGAPAL